MSLMACSAVEPEPPSGEVVGELDVCRDLYSQISDQPEEDAQRAFSGGDRRYLSGTDSGFAAPGLSKRELDQIIRLSPVPVRFLQGFEDHADVNPCLQFAVDGGMYMERFNREIARLSHNSQRD